MHKVYFYVSNYWTAGIMHRLLFTKQTQTLCKDYTVVLKCSHLLKDNFKPVHFFSRESSAKCFRIYMHCIFPILNSSSLPLLFSQPTKIKWTFYAFFVIVCHIYIHTVKIMDAYIKHGQFKQ